MNIKNSLEDIIHKILFPSNISVPVLCQTVLGAGVSSEQNSLRDAVSIRVGGEQHTTWVKYILYRIAVVSAEENKAWEGDDFMSFRL